MSIKLLIKDFLLASEISQCVSTAQLANNLHPLDGSALVVCQRFITHLARQGVPMGQGHFLSMCMRIIQSRPKGDRTVLTVLAPVYRNSINQLWTTVVIKVSVPNQGASAYTSDLKVGMCLRIDPLWIWDFELPCTEFRVDRFEVIESPLINPFDYVDRRGLGPGVYYRQTLGYSPNRSGDELIPLGDLISLLASMCRFMDPHDLMLLDHMAAKNRFERFVIPSPNMKQRRVVAKHLFEQRFANFMIEDAALDLLARLVLGLRELRRAVQQCGEMLVVELRRKGQTDVNALNDFQLTVREMHVREVISKNKYKLNTLFECQLDA